MTQFKTVQEILEYGIAKELESYNTYMALMKITKDPDIYNVLESFAQEELQHKANLELEIMKEGLVVSGDENWPEVDMSFKEAASICNLEMTYKNILLASMHKEEASFRLYIKLAFHAKNPE